MRKVSHPKLHVVAKELILLADQVGVEKISVHEKEPQLTATKLF